MMVVRPEDNDDNFTAIYKPLVDNMWEPRHITRLWSSTVCYRVRNKSIYMQAQYLQFHLQSAPM
jgi:hypothetical protein